MNENIIKKAILEAEWLRYYCYEDYRKREIVDSLDFYDVAKPIGYSKVYTPLIHKTNMGVVEGLELNEKTLYQSQRDHKNNRYTAMEYCLVNNIEKEKILSIICD